MPSSRLINRCSALAIGAAVSSQAVYPNDDAPMIFEDDQVWMQLVLRTPTQLGGFYHGREFNQAAIDKILETCFITPLIRNKTIDVLWLELDHWRFTQGNIEIPRIKRDYWPEQWRAAKLSQAHQSTFGWTLLPEIRDLRIDEGVGGSLVIPMQADPFTLTANFYTGADKKGAIKSIVFEGVQCVSDEE